MAEVRAAGQVLPAAAANEPVALLAELTGKHSGVEIPRPGVVAQLVVPQTSDKTPNNINPFAH